MRQIRKLVILRLSWDISRLLHDHGLHGNVLHRNSLLINILNWDVSQRRVISVLEIWLMVTNGLNMLLGLDQDGVTGLWSVLQLLNLNPLVLSGKLVLLNPSALMLSLLLILHIINN